MSALEQQPRSQHSDSDTEDNEQQRQRDNELKFTISSLAAPKQKDINHDNLNKPGTIFVNTNMKHDVLKLYIRYAVGFFGIKCSCLFWKCFTIAALPVIEYIELQTAAFCFNALHTPIFLY